MKPYDRIPFWENRRRVKRLEAFLSTLTSYFQNQSNSLYEEQNRFARTFINTNSLAIERIIHATGIPIAVDVWHSSLTSSVAIPLIPNVLNLDNFGISEAVVVDMLERTIGAYKEDDPASLLRTFNPFWWMGQVPFFVAGGMGLPIGNIQYTTLGKGISFVFSMLQTLAAALAIYQFLAQS